MYGLGVGWWDKFSQTPGLVFLMSLPTEFFDYVEWPDILYLGREKNVSNKWDFRWKWLVQTVQ